MARILYGAPKSEWEEENNLVAKLRQKHTVTYLNGWLGFALELIPYKEILFGEKASQKRYDLLCYDTRLYGEQWLPQVRGESFKSNITGSLKRAEIPVIILADGEIKDQIKNFVEDNGLHYIAQPYAINEVVRKVNALLKKPRRKKKQ